MKHLRRLALAILLLLFSVIPGSVPLTAVALAQTGAAQASAAHAAWWADQRWRYATDGEAEAAYQALVARESPWPEWHQSHLVVLPAGLRFQMAIAPGQPTDRPGAFGTFDRITSVEFVRLSLAVKSAWKPTINRVVTYEITSPLLTDVGSVGPQIDGPANRYLPGGGSQFQMMVPAAERMQHLRVVDVRPIQ